ncbi:MAG TPA: LLM class F420-dependent oxidoreductase [Acidimicrobiales bacterium]|jgi:probable F420-dependent oxidoreductase|nr:LLM class F420-dependent oxidoreductase [Acidimicrobiales bacterium]
MKIGAIVPQLDLGADRGAIREYGQSVDEIGFDHLLAFDHVVGADPAVHVGWAGPYDLRSTFHEPFVLFGFLAGICPTLEFATGIVILPQRQTVLVAKQAAEVDILSDGRFRLGVGIGWNAVEYESLGERFNNRGRRIEEQIELLRRLWTEQSVTFDGTFHHVTGAGIAPMPIQQPIPLWMGGGAGPALERVGRLADGWFSNATPGPQLDGALTTIRDAARAAGRDPSGVGIEGRIMVGDGDQDRIAKEFEEWENLEASHVSFNTMGANLRDVGEHISALRSAFDTVRGARKGG